MLLNPRIKENSTGITLLLQLLTVFQIVEQLYFVLSESSDTTLFLLDLWVVVLSETTRGGLWSFFLVHATAQIHTYERNVQNCVVIPTLCRLSMLKKEKSKKIIQLHKLYCIFIGTKQGIAFCRMKISVCEDMKICSVLQNLILKNQNQRCVGFLFSSLASFLFLPLTWILGYIKVTFVFGRKRRSVMQKL